MQMILKRLVVWLLEALIQTFLVGSLLSAVLFPDFGSVLEGIPASALAVGFLLFFHGYYLTTGIFGVVWRSQKSWLYPAIAATLFAIHMHIVFVRGKRDLTALARASELPFLGGGAFIGLSCAFCGIWLLRKWLVT